MKVIFPYETDAKGFICYPDNIAHFGNADFHSSPGNIIADYAGNLSLEQYEPVTAASPAKLSRLAYMQRFTIAEEAAIRTAGKTNPVIEVILARLAAAEFVDLADASTREGIAYMTSAKLLTAERASAILEAGDA